MRKIKFNDGWVFHEGGAGALSSLIEIDQEEAEKIVSVGDAVEEIKNALNN